MNRSAMQTIRFIEQEQEHEHEHEHEHEQGQGQGKGHHSMENVSAFLEYERGS